MFGRRVVSSAPIPRFMYAKLGISTPKQAARLLPSMVQLTPSLERSVSGCVGGLLVSSVSGLAVAPTDIAVPPNLLTALGISGQALLSILNMNPILIRMISDTMCTYSVILPTSSI